MFCSCIYTFHAFILQVSVDHMGHAARKPVFWVSGKMRFKPACSATETNYKSEISPVSSLDMILSNKQIIKALINCEDAQAGLHLCCSQTLEDRPI